jgi:hypothetical protein
VTNEDWETYLRIRREEVGKRLQGSLESPIVRRWLEEFSERELYEEKDGAEKYMGDANAEGDAKAALERAKATADPIEMVAAVEYFILCFCGFSVMKPLKARGIINAVHSQFNVDVNRLLGTSLPLPSKDGAPTDAEKALFDDADVAFAELLLRCVVETSDGNLIGSPFSAGAPMGKLLKLPLFAQFVMVLINAVEAVWYQEEIPTCPMAINLYASLLVAEAPVLQMISGVKVIEIMELTKGAKRGPEVDDWVDVIRATGATVLLDDFDAKHPGIGSKPDGIKVSVFANAFHSLQTFKNEPLGEEEEMLLPITAIPFVEKEKVNAFDVVDYHGSIVPKYQPGAKILVMEGSENCLKSEAKEGPPLNFKEPGSTTASAHVYQAAARAMLAHQPEGQAFQMLHQGGRALYEDEEFDAEACAVIEACGKSMPAARAGEAGTMAWIGEEAVRRVKMQSRLPVSGVKKVD